MPKPNLIQRGKFKEVIGPVTGIDMLIDLDYMGSSEFESGALPSSLKELCKVVNELTIVHSGWTDLDSHGLFIICKKSYVEQATKYVHGLMADTYRLKEQSRLIENMNGTATRWHITNFWWDIENHYMFCIGKKNAVKVMKAIRAVRCKKEAEGVAGWY